MDQHAVPRQITSFEFKLIGFMTLHQFIYLVIFAPLGLIAYKLFPIPILNILLGLVVASMGAALAFLPINERPLEVWIRNMIKRLNSPTQFFYLKNNPLITIFQNLYYSADPHQVMAHIDSQQKLAGYLASTRKAQANLRQPVQYKTNPVTPVTPVAPIAPDTLVDTTSATPIDPSILNTPQPEKESVAIPVQTTSRQPFFIGVVKNNRRIPLPGILLYVKDAGNQTVRLLKTNPHGVFATYGPLTQGDYNFEIKDPKGTFFFDTMKIKVEETNLKPLEFISKEML